jgi:hypothetical protein
MVFNRARFEFIKGVFVREMELYSWKLLVHGKKEKRAKARADKFHTINWDLCHKLLTFYIQRCKYKHSLAFMQFRKLLPGAKICDIMEIFNDRKEHLLKIAQRVQSRIKTGKLKVRKLVSNTELSAEEVAEAVGSEGEAD